MSLSQDAANSRGVRVAELPGRAEAADAGLCGCVSAPCFGVGRALRDGAGELCAFPQSCDTFRAGRFWARATHHGRHVLLLSTRNGASTRENGIVYFIICLVTIKLHN